MNDVYEYLEKDAEGDQRLARGLVSYGLKHCSGLSFEDAMGMYHDFFLKMRNVSTYDSVNYDNPSAYIWVSWKWYCVINMSRLARNKEKVSLDDCFGLEGIVSSENPTSTERQDFVRGAVDRLPPKLKELVYLSYFEGLSISEIACEVGLRHNSVKTRLNVARRRMKIDLMMRHKGLLDDLV